MAQGKIKKKNRIFAKHMALVIAIYNVWKI